MNPRPIAWSISDHAAERYCKRVDQRLAPSGAVILLRQLLPKSTLLPEPTLSGQQRWLLPSGDAVVVAKPDPKLRAHVAVTVLGPREMYDVDAVDDVVEAFQRATSPVSTPEPMPPAKVRVVDVAPKPTKVVGPEMVSREHLDAAHATLRAAYAREEKLRTAHANLSQAHNALKSKRDPDAAQLQRDLDEARRQLKTSGAAEKLREHAKRMEEDRDETRGMLRVAVAALRVHDTPIARAALAELERRGPGITGDAFCYPERFTKEERKAAKVAARAAAQAAEGAS